jgi:hypothetical protein
MSRRDPSGSDRSPSSQPQVTLELFGEFAGRLTAWMPGLCNRPQLNAVGPATHELSAQIMSLASLCI